MSVLLRTPLQRGSCLARSRPLLRAPLHSQFPPPPPRPRLSVSHAIGPTSPPLSMQTIGQILHDVALEHATKSSVISVHQDVTLSYAELDRLASVLAANLASKYNITKGDRVSVCCGNLWEYPVLQFGLARLGAILVPINPAFTIKQLHNALHRSDSRLLIIQAQLFKGVGKPLRDVAPMVEQFLESSTGASVEGRTPLPNLDAVLVLPSTPQGPIPKGTRYFDELLSETDSFPDDPASAEEVINMQFTSGTTSEPKLSSLTHLNLVNNGRYIGHRMGLSATQSSHPSGQDHLCVPVPMFHCFGLVLSNLAAISQGACVVYPSDGFNPQKTLAAVRKHSCTALHGVPTMFAVELELREEIEKGGLKSLRTGIAAGSPVPVEIMKKLDTTFGMTGLTICYGMTETSPVSFMSYPTDSVEKRVSTVGTLLPFTEAKVVQAGDKELKPLPLGQRGEIAVAGYCVQKEYFRDPKRTAEALIPDTNGKKWMLTGDEGVLDEEGFLTVTGRIKDLIIRGGENIHPLEIENVLFQHPAVQQASVVGVPDAKYGEAVAAFIIIHADHKNSPPPVDDLKEFINSHLGHYLVPKYFLFVEDFPKTTSGKIRKVDLRETAIKTLLN